MLQKAVRKSVVMALSLAFCSSAVWANEVIKIGLAGPHTGDLAPYGLPTKAAAEMVIAEVNAAGGINGKKVVLVPGDDQCKPELATNVASKLVSEGVKVVIGHTDTVGSRESNDELSRQRAASVRAMLIEAGFPADKMEIAGRGERELLVPTANEVDEPRNRRVEINIR